MRNDSTETLPHGASFGRRALLALVLGIVLAGGVAAVRWFVAPDDLEQATAALQRGDEAAAIAALKAHLQVQPDSTAARLRLATLWQESQPKAALEVLSRIPRSDPQWITALQQIAVIHVLSEQTEAADKALLELIAAVPENWGAQLTLAELRFRNKDPQSALPFALEAVRLAPERAQTFLLVAEIYDDLHNHAAMIEPLQAALALDPEFYEARLNLAYAHHKLGQLAPAEAQARWCLKTHPTDVAALRILASVARDEGRFADAEALLAKTLKIAPDDVDCRILEADLLLYRRKPHEAYARLKELHDAHRETARYLGALARAAAAAGEREAARRHYQAVENLLQERRKAGQ